MQACDLLPSVHKIRHFGEYWLLFYFTVDARCCISAVGVFMTVACLKHIHVVFMAALCNRGAIIFLPCSFYLLSIFLFFSSPNLSGRRLDVYHTSAHGVALVRI